MFQNRKEEHVPMKKNFDTKHSIQFYHQPHHRPIQILAQVEIPYEPFKLYLFADHIWCVAYTRQKDSSRLCVYSKDCQLLKELKHSKISNATALTQSDEGSLLVSCYADQGLHELSSDGETYHSKVTTAGSYSDLMYHRGNKSLYTLEYKKCEIEVFKKDVEGNWREVQKIHLDHSVGNACDRLIVRKDAIYVSTFKENHVYFYTLKGQLLHKFGGYGESNPGQFNGVSLCSADITDHVLVADCYNHRLQVLQNCCRKWDVVSLDFLEVPVDVAVDGDIMWVIKQGKSMSLLKMCIKHTKNRPGN